jgi:chaperonin GroES
MMHSEMNSEQAAYPSQEETEQPDTEIMVAALDTNIAEELDEEKLKKLGMDAKKDFDSDEMSRKAWLMDTKDWLDLAMQVREQKSFPWPDASNVKYPLISTASLQFNARAYPTLVPGDGKLVKTRVLGKDPGQKKAQKAERVATYMSWQFMYDMETWDSDMDRLFIMLPVCGILIKKSYFSREEDKVVSKLVYPENFVVDYYTTDLEDAERTSEIIFMPERVLKQRQRMGHFLEVDLGKPSVPLVSDPGKAGPPQQDKATPFKLIEQHRWEDLDDDGVEEPYIVTFHYDSGKILRISPNFTPEDLVMEGRDVVKVTKHIDYYTKYGFIPNPDGSFYDLGFGHLLGPINEAVNTLVNQLVDAGTISNLQSGFIGKGLKLKMGDHALQPGEWKAVNGTGDDLRKQIVPLPTKEPSTVLFQLLGMLVTSGKELASVAEIFVGKMPGQNTPATTTMASIEQGMKVFTAIYKRVYRAMQKEFKKVYKLNGMYLNPQTYTAVLDEPVGPEDFQDKSYDICPTADPVATTQQEKLLKAQALMELLPSGMLDPAKVLMRVLQAQEQPDWQELIPGMAESGQPTPPQPKQDPKLQEMQKKAEIEEKKGAQQMQMAQEKHQMEMSSEQAKLAMEQQSMAQKQEHEATMIQLKTAGAVQNQKVNMADSMMKLQTSQAENQQKLQQTKEQGDLKLQQQKKQAASSSSTGKASTSRKSSSKQSKSGSKT